MIHQVILLSLTPKRIWKKKDDEDPKEDPADNPTYRDDDDEEEEESFEDDADDKEKDEDEEEEEEHLALVDSVLPPAYHTTTRMLRAESPSTSHPLSLSPPIILTRTRASMAMMRADAPSTYYLASRSETPPSGKPPLLPIPLPTSSPPLLLPSTDCRADVLEVMLPPRKRLCIAPDPRYEIRESLTAPTARLTGGFRADYGFVGTLDAEIRQDLDREVGYGITDTWDEMDTDEIYRRRDDAQDDRSLMSSQLNLLCRDRRSHARMARLMKSEARASLKTWVQSMDASDTTRFK
ncbi:hypothetical protein Tco_1581248, partial [Tanacetum coccineum]